MSAQLDGTIVAFTETIVLVFPVIDIERPLAGATVTCTGMLMSAGTET